ncbi:MAG: helix-turn-helix transcriptional regulator [Janibacter sp.]
MPLAPRTRALVGRTPELARLRRGGGLDGSAAGGSVLLSGDAGIGKSRLVAEVAAEAVERNRVVVTGHCVGAGGAALAWLPFVELTADLEAQAPDAVRETLDSHPALAALLPGGTSGPSPADPARIGEAVHALLTATARDRPVLVVIEDVHWADDSSRDLLTLLLTRGFSTAASLLVTYRSDDLHRRHPLHDVLSVWTRLPLVTRLDLTPLSGTHMDRLVRSLDEAPTTPDDIQHIIGRAEGNPFFAEEIVAAGDAARTTDDLARLLRLRLDRLSGPARHLVHAASLAGGSVSTELLGEVAECDVDGLDQALRESIDHHILEVDTEGDFRFRHALLGETIADDLLPGARRRLHSAWLTALRAHPGLGAAADLARHAAATGDTETAAAAAIEAGDAAMQVGGARDALRHYEAALGWIVDDPGHRGEVALAAATAARTSGDQMRSLRLLEEALTEVDAETHPVVRAQLLGKTAAWYTILDLPGDPLALSAEAVAILPDRSTPVAAGVLLRRLEVLVDAQREEDAALLGDEIALLAEELDLPSVAAEKRLQLARLLAASDPDRAREGLLATVDDTRARPALRLSALLRLGTLELNAGRPASAHEYFTKGVAIADERHRPWGPFGMECRLQAGRTAYELGRWPEAERLLASPADLPHPPRGFMEGALVELLVARGDDVDPERLSGTIRWWEVDVLLVVACLGGLIDLLGRLGEGEQLRHLVDQGVDTMSRLWSRDAQAIIRIAALFTGQVADLAARHHDVTLLRVRSDDYAVRVAPFVGPEHRTGPESEAWLTRHSAERLRLAAVTGQRPDADELVLAWQRAVDGFAVLPNLPERARSRARLAEVLALVGRVAESRDVAATAREEAEALGASPVLDILDGEPPEDVARSQLTPREREVLDHLDRGRTNGQIADALFISRKTASVHVSNILAKLGAATRGEAVAVAREHGLIG